MLRTYKFKSTVRDNVIRTVMVCKNALTLIIFNIEKVTALDVKYIAFY